MTVFVIVLVALDVLALALVLAAAYRRRGATPPISEHGDVFVAPRPAGLRGRERTLLSIEVLDPGAVAAARGRALGLVGTVAPRLVRRVVYDQVRKIVVSQLAAEGVRADVRVHSMRAASPGEVAQDIVEAVVVDAPPPVDLR